MRAQRGAKSSRSSQNSRSFSSLLAFSHNWIRSNSALIRLAEDRVPQSNDLAGRSTKPSCLVKLGNSRANLSLWSVRGPIGRCKLPSQAACGLFHIVNLDGAVPIFLLQPYPYSFSTSSSRLSRSRCFMMTGHPAVRSMLTCSPRPTAVSPDRCPKPPNGT